MSINVHGSADKKASPNLIPAKTRLWVHVTIKDRKTSQNGGRYYNLELTVADNQPHAGRKIFEMLTDPTCPDLQNRLNNGVGDIQQKAETTFNMSIERLGCMLEGAANGPKATPENPAAYEIDDDLHNINGLVVPVVVKIEVDKTGEYDDKNKVGLWLSPNPNRRGHKDYEALMKGDHGGVGGPVAAPAQQTMGFGNGQAPAQAAAAPAPAATPAAPAQSPYGEGAAQQGPAGWPGST